MRAYPNDSRTGAGIRSCLAGFSEKIDTSLRPVLPTGALVQQPCSAQFVLQGIEQTVKALEVLQAVLQFDRCGEFLRGEEMDGNRWWERFSGCF